METQKLSKRKNTHENKISPKKRNINSLKEAILDIKFENDREITISQTEYYELEPEQIKTILTIKIHGNLVLDNPSNMFESSVIENIEGDVTLIGRCNNMFTDAVNFNGIIENWDTSNVTNMGSMFYGATIFNQKLKWNTSKVVNMGYMFMNATDFNQELEWNTASVINMEAVFMNATSFDQELKWNTSSVINMSSMFYGAVSFDQKLEWNTSNLVNMESMFYGATSFNKELEWDTSNVVNMSAVFRNATSFDKELKWDTSSVDTMNRMFYGATSFNKTLKWDVSSVRYMSDMFCDATSFDQELIWDTSNVEYMGSMFTRATSFNQKLDWETINVVDMSNMFYQATSFDQELNWDTSSVTDMSLMFYETNQTIIDDIKSDIQKERIISAEFKLINAWFNGLDDRIRKNLTISCKWYSYQIDGYLNSIYRNEIYPSAKLDNHIANLKDNAQTFSSYKESTYNRLCEEVKSPFEDFVEIKSVQKDVYIERIKQVTLFVHSIFIQYYYTLTSPIKVYRGMTVPISNTLSLNMIGINSVSLSLDIANSFMFKMAPKYKKGFNNNYLIELELPVGTKVIPMKICSTIEEYELVIIDQGQLRIVKNSTLAKTIYNEEEEDDEEEDDEEEELSYSYIIAVFEKNNRLPVYNNFVTI
jgi:hypothetical protein